MADRNPGVIPPPANSPPLKLAAGNSRNHDQAGQNVLYGDWHVEFQATPYCGVEDDKAQGRHDNIYTALTPTPLQKGQSPPVDANRCDRKRCRACLAGRQLSCADGARWRRGDCDSDECARNGTGHRAGANNCADNSACYASGDPARNRADHTLISFFGPVIPSVALYLFLAK